MRLAVIGTSGSGKSTLAQAVAQKLGIKYIEMDRYFWLPGWKEAPKDQFANTVLNEITSDAWTICGNHTLVQEKIWNRATHIVWLNYSLTTCLRQVLPRTFQRVFFKTECCNGNRESFRQTFFSKNSILWWILKTHKRRRRQYRAAQISGQFANAVFLEFTHPNDANEWLKRISWPPSQDHPSPVARSP